MNIQDLADRKGVVFGWWCILVHDYPEPEGTVYFDHTPKVGERFTLPSSGHKETWVVDSVNKHDMEFTAKGPVVL